MARGESKSYDSAVPLLKSEGPQEEGKGVLLWPFAPQACERFFNNWLITVKPAYPVFESNGHTVGSRESFSPFIAVECPSKQASKQASKHALNDEE